ncbi:MAG: hypothetical protein PHU14_13305 [Methylovulum sp.]|nr:hypothetical protein [Methylovulum sp.]
MDNKIETILRKAVKAIDSGDCQQAFELLSPLIDENYPESLFLYSTFSLSKIETESEFEARRIRLLQIASEAGYVPAIYELAVCYDVGDFVNKDNFKASGLYKKAAEGGNSKAKLYHGLNLFYGSNGLNRDQKLGLDYIKQAATEGIEEAGQKLIEISA